MRPYERKNIIFSENTFIDANNWGFYQDRANPNPIGDNTMLSEDLVLESLFSNSGSLEEDFDMFRQGSTTKLNPTELKAKYRGAGLPPGGRDAANKQKEFFRKREAVIKKQRPIGGKPPIQRFTPFPKPAVRPKPPKVMKPEKVE